MTFLFSTRSVFFLFLFLFIGVAQVNAQTPPQYDIKATLDVDHKTIAAQQNVTWTNDTEVDVSELVFHIYPHRRYTVKEAGFIWRFAGYFKVNPFPGGFDSGSMKIISVKQHDQPLTYVIEGEDQTILKIKLSEPVKSRASVTVSLDFSVDIPHATIGRLGWNDNVFRLSRWYPILSVYDPHKGWSKNPFYLFHRPFYSEASQYKVALTVPPKSEIVSSGHQSAQVQETNGLITTIYESQLPIREFSFAMSPDYKSISSEVNGVWIKSFYLPGHEKAGEMALECAKQLMKFYSDRFGAYPYQTFSIAPVDLGYGGEQMSNLIYIDRRAYELPGMMKRYFDFLVAHETGHQWFYNLVGVDEYEEMWLEEGFNSYFIEQYLAQKYGEDAEVIDFPRWAEKARQALPKLTFKNTRDTRYKSIARMGKDHAIISKLSSFSEPSAIFSVTYGKGSRVLGMLKYYIGEEAFTRVFQRIFSEYRFKNFCVADFIRIAEEESGQDLESFFTPWLYGNEQLNYSVASVGKKTVTLKNKGGISSPAEVKVNYRDGTTESFFWKGSPQTEQIQLSNASGVKTVVVDPDAHLLDIDRTNNYWPRRLHVQPVVLYTALREISTMLPEDGYTLTVGPEIANGGLGLKASIQKPYDQIVYAGSDYDFSEKLHHSRVGYELRNVLRTPTVLGVQMSNVTDYDDGDEDLVSGKLYVRRELWPAQYNVADINDHVSLYVIRNQSVNQGSDVLQREGVRNTRYLRHDEAIVGSALHLERSGPAPDPRQGYKLDLFAENSGHFLEATQTFSRAAIDTSTYLSVTARSKTAFRVKYGGGYPNDKELFYAGGIDGLRGYERKSLRGSNMLLGSLEYRFPLIDGLKISFFDHILGLESVSGVVFGDVGEAWYTAVSDVTLRKDAGLGLRFTVNIGSLFEKVLIRADVAQAINDHDEDHPRFWLGINQAF
jgi:hypothetical protein